MSTSTLTVTHHENRAGENPENVAYGFVYFSDGTRLAYTSFDGVAADATGGWEPVTKAHEKAAEEYLRAQGILTA
jgi:hypothetical protein